MMEKHTSKGSRNSLRTQGKWRVAPLRIKVVIHESEDGGYWAQVTALPSCVTQGRTLKELYANVREAVGGILLSTSGTFEAEPGGRITEIPL